MLPPNLCFNLAGTQCRDQDDLDTYAAYYPVLKLSTKWLKISSLGRNSDEKAR